ncbi:D-Ala-D-Ala carboxypeptidase family metallohydrolase [Spirulina sp. CCNP1310]|uniref:D-Ala-D-Ala carboxypeptidase family metallohydrolase n=1 Tax=Spirulina sp. CCNP1310 TaxID=3110249 RepID=UPI002B20F3C5|nr:D-Ala-D-Ala carboxypeptidase family metallohydrolase [Spirulina sp. CCNP1310]MEA5418826.1 D-Ala-D-Ala carboxypeptidase family metallohydrolase [Spirulina sp. CCNP1310]
MSKKPQLLGSVPLKDVKDRETVRWVQAQLAVGGYLAPTDADGLVGPKTLAALAAFKKDFYLAFPADLGPSTIDALADIEPKHEVIDQAPKPTATNLNAGTKSGASATLPKVGLIYANEMIVPGSFITWGEMTNNLTRLPYGTSEFGSPEQVVTNMIAMAKAFGKVRTKFGSPITITSAYRPPNLAIGVGKSQHKYGRALDVSPLNGDYQGLLDAIRAVPEVKGVGLAGPSKGFWHLDIRPGSRVSFSY